MNEVVEAGPAWESGVRAGDVIVTINDWLIVLMDRPQVSLLTAFPVEPATNPFWAETEFD